MDDKIKIFYFDGTVSIDSDNLRYCNIKDMYINNQNGVGIQVNEGLDENTIEKLCNEISNLLYDLKEVLYDRK